LTHVERSAAVGPPHGIFPRRRLEQQKAFTP
jgi:hypothetical protein